MDVDDFVALGLDRSLWELEPGLAVNGRSNAEINRAMQAPGDDRYQPCPEAFPGDDVVPGSLIQLPDWSASGVYPGTLRDVWIHVPAGLDRQNGSPGLIVFQDGGAYLDTRGAVRATMVLDSLNARTFSPPLVGVFVNPGHPPAKGDAQRDGLAAMLQRSIEYDTCNGRYASFLSGEIVPLVEAQIGCRIAPEPARRILCGISSGGIAAFNAAWHAPERFAGVISHCGSFTNIRGGHTFPYLVRTTPRKAIRVVLQSGSQDADILYGSWPLANQAMASALDFAGYDYRFLFGEGGHSLRHGGATFADSLRWLVAPAMPNAAATGQA
jgi:enterochelin esterase-like enzyme